MYDKNLKCKKLLHIIAVFSTELNTVMYLDV